MLCVCVFVCFNHVFTYGQKKSNGAMGKNISNNETVSREKLAGAWKGGKELGVFSI